MKIMSEKTGKEYKTVEECLAAEKALEEQLAKEKAEKEAKEKALVAKKEAALAERKADAEQVEVARKAMVEANRAYNKAMQDFLKKHGSYHRTWHYTGDEALKAWNDFFDSFWF